MTDDDDDVDAMASRLLSNGWADKLASATPQRAPDTYVVRWRKSGFQEQWIISRNGKKEWSGYDPAALVQQKRIIEARGGKIVDTTPRGEDE